MNTAASPFTPLESLLLFQSILKHGFDPQAFAQISASLRNNSFIRSDESYNADRLSSESLQQLFLRLLRDELKAEEHSRNNGSSLPTPGFAAGAAAPAAAAATTGAGNLSPNSKKRKLPSPALPTVSDVHAHSEKLPMLVGRLYARYRNHVVAAIREDERKLEQIQGEIRVLEQAEEAEQKNRQTSAGPARAGTPSAGANEEAPAAPPPATMPRLAEGLGQSGSIRQLPPTATPLVAAGTQLQPDATSAKVHGSPLPTTTSKTQKPAAPAVASLPPTASRIKSEAAPPSTETPQPRPTSPQPLQTTTCIIPEPKPATRTPQSPSTGASLTGPPAPLQPFQGGSKPSTAEHATPSISGGAATEPRSQTPPGAQPGATGKATLPSKPAQAPATPRKTPPSLPPSQPQPPPPQPQSQAAGQVKQLSAAAAVQGPAAQPQPATPTSRAGFGTQRPVHAFASTPLAVPQAALQPPTTQTMTPLSVPTESRAESRAEPQTETKRPPLPAVKPSHISIQPQSVRHGQHHGAHAPGGHHASATPAGTSSVLSAPGSAPSAPLSQLVPSASSSAAQGNPALHANRSLLPQHVQMPGSSETQAPTQSPITHLPHTPAHLSLGGFLPRGSGTRWKSNDPTPSTPKPDVGGIASPAYEPLSPVMGFTSSRFSGAESVQRKQRQPKKSHAIKAGNKPETTGGRPRGRPPRNPKPPAEVAIEHGHVSQPNIKHEASTPKAFEDIGETTTEEGGTANKSSTASPSGPLSRPFKRKREESVDFASPGKPQLSSHMRRRPSGPAVPPTHVLWMRGFPRISASALDQISSHRNANMFAHRIRDRDAPGYDSIVRHPVDLKMIRMAIIQGNKAATAAAAALPESEQSSSSSLWLPISEELVPPRGIINSSQLECELVHMFANAIMYNPDSHRGPGLAFMESEATEDDVGATDAGGNSYGNGYGNGNSNSNSARYKVDEDGVVNDTRDMYIEVEKLLSEMRSAERQRGVPPPPPSAKGLGFSVNGRPGGGGGAGRIDGAANVVEANTDAVSDAEPGADDGNGADATANDEAHGHGSQDGADEEVEEPAAEGYDASGAAKRRRITRGQ